jgi:hypothetical protein
MRTASWCGAALIGLVLAGGTARGQQWVAPPPGPVPAEHPPLGLPPGVGFPRVSAYDVWQYRSPDSAGFWRDRVILTPHGAYRLADGAPFPWTSSNPLIYRSTPFFFMPYAD